MPQPLSPRGRGEGRSLIPGSRFPIPLYFPNMNAEPDVAVDVGADAQGHAKQNPWSYVPVLYFLQGVPVMIIQGMAGTMYTKMGITLGALGLWTSLIKLPWMLKPLWAPLVEVTSTKRRWIVWMQALIALSLVGAAFTITQSWFFAASLSVFFVTAFLSSTHDIAADGFYLLALDRSRQAFFVGIRSAAFRLGTLFATFFLVFIAGDVEERTGNIPYSWFIALLVGAGVYGVFALVNAFAMPHPPADLPGSERALGDKVPVVEAFVSFFKQERILAVLVFILFFRFGESMISTMGAPFLLKPIAEGGMGPAPMAHGGIGGAVGVGALVAGGLLGGWLISKKGIKRCVWPMVLALNVPNLAYIWLAMTRPASHVDAALASAPANMGVFSGEWFSYVGTVFSSAFTDPVGLVIALDQFGYGFGLAAYLVYLMFVSQGSKYPTANYAVATGLMALGAMLAGSISGFLAHAMAVAHPGNGFLYFFAWVMAFTVPGMLVLFFIPMDKDDIKEAVIDLD